jgi:hypothetical protein
MSPLNQFGESNKPTYAEMVVNTTWTDILRRQQLNIARLAPPQLAVGTTVKLAKMAQAKIRKQDIKNTKRK